MQRYMLFFFVLLILFPGYVTAQQRIAKTVSPTTPILRFEKAEWDITLHTPFRNPYDQKELQLDMVLTAPSGKPWVLPCYFDQGDTATSQWKARFAARETGTYHYYFRLTTAGRSEETTPQTFTAQPGKKPGFLHTNDHWTFRFDNGELFRGIGENVGWESRNFENDKWTYDYLLPTLSKNGANYFRTWMCPWNLPLETQKVNSTKRYVNSTEYFHPGGIQRMEQLLHLIDSLGLYMMLTLDMNSGNWNNSSYNQANGGPVKTYTEFFSQPAAMEKYKNKLRYVVARWGYSTHIGAWEFFNEIDNGVFTRSDSILIPHVYVTHWHREMSRYLKDIDPYQHLVTTSISHRDIDGLNSIPYIDFNQKHIYKHTGKIPAIYPAYIETYGKPYVVGEFGFRWEDQDPKYAREANYDYKRGLWFGLFSATPILPMSWWWELFDDQKMTPYFRGVRAISDKMLQAGKGRFEQLPISAEVLHVQAVQCGNTAFAYLLNESDGVATTAVKFPLTAKSYTVQSYDPNTLQYKTLTGGKLANGQFTSPTITLPAKQELLLLVTVQ
ncbi:DUF5060 domain-containing protein [Paraflavitalea pollutisoli]|uniref:DUF5060 domain-containing protein n=1 Tax=Paraflavitalea pollutisoli TaxID=3034143 RepID=UPI0023ECEDF9|nr:DUF5060 domain-containing protein [Paraflavitalea sp. H1-2-19X]